MVSVASLFPENRPKYGDCGFKQRRMATINIFSGSGYGKEIIKFALQYINENNAAYLWCNARDSASGFYQKISFEIISPKFKIEGIGPHYEMILTIN